MHGRGKSTDEQAAPSIKLRGEKIELPGQIEQSRPPIFWIRSKVRALELGAAARYKPEETDSLAEN